MSEGRCDDCKRDHLEVRAVPVSTIPGSADGKIVTMHICEGCYESNDWAAVDLTGTPWLLTLRER